MKKKRVLISLMIGAAALGLVACGKGGSSKKDESSSESLFVDTNLTKFKVNNKLAYLGTISTAMTSKTLEILENDDYSVISADNKLNLFLDFKDNFNYFEIVYQDLGLIKNGVDAEE